MKTHFYKLLLMANIFLLSLVSCKKLKKIEITLMRVSYTPAFHNPVEIIVDLKSKTFMLFSPYETPLELQPPYFDEKEDKYLSENPQIEPFISELTETEAKEIKDLALKLKDFRKNEDELFVEGMVVNTVIFYSNKTTKQINFQVSSGEHPLYKRLIHLALAKNKSKNNTIILNKIEDYF